MEEKIPINIFNWGPCVVQCKIKEEFRQLLLKEAKLNDIDFRDLIEGGWYQSIRIHGEFGRQTPTFVEDQYENSDWKIRQINPSIEYEWFLETHYLPEGVKNQIVDNQTLANRTVITDYNLLNDGIYREKELSFNDFDTVEHAGRGTKYVLKWKEKKNDLRLRF